MVLGWRDQWRHDAEKYREAVARAKANELSAIKAQSNAEPSGPVIDHDPQEFAGVVRSGWLLGVIS